MVTVGWWRSLVIKYLEIWSRKSDVKLLERDWETVHISLKNLTKPP